uniref:Uncharacterized protein n=1 Tax=Rhizophora mucronata TaxID=61149 RepID=A0A2P2N8S2_RHIMU
MLNYTKAGNAAISSLRPFAEH